SKTLDHPAEDMRPTRMVVVTASFPYKDQLEEFRRALRMKTGDTAVVPKFTGLLVKKSVRLPGQKDWGKWEDLDLEHSETGLKKPLQSAREYDMADINPIPRDGVVDGLATPRPALATLKYPRVLLKGVFHSKKQREEIEVVSGPA